MQISVPAAVCVMLSDAGPSLEGRKELMAGVPCASWHDWLSLRVQALVRSTMQMYCIGPISFSCFSLLVVENAEHILCRVLAKAAVISAWFFKWLDSCWNLSTQNCTLSVLRLSPSSRLSEGHHSSPPGLQVGMIAPRIIFTLAACIALHCIKG